MLDSLTRENWSAVLDQVVDDLLARGGITAPPVDALALAHNLQITVAIDQRQTARGRLKEVGGRVAIFLRPEPRLERRQWATAHEIGESVAWRIFEQIAPADAEIEPQWRERVANDLASRLLLPSPWYADAIRGGAFDLFDLKSRFSTASHELIAWRSLDFEPPAVITVFDQGRLTRRRDNSGGTPAVLPLERECRSKVAATKESCRLTREGLQVAGWPIHEPDQCREILRTTCAELMDCGRFVDER